jgi:acyl transferase domain-containing protein/glutamate-1-semialdehyde aminotransferase
MSYADAYDSDAGVAIVALAGRFPGARDVEGFWRNLVEGRETISRFSEDELEPARSSDMAARKEPTYVRARGILEDIEMFDAAFFKISPREAEVTDPQQRLFLETAWEALERAGYDPEVFAGTIGVFAGMSNNTYYLANLLGRPDVLQHAGEFPMLGNEKDYLATRVSYKLNLRGPSLNIVTACSTSLVAVCQAVQSLLTHQCDMALAGGVSVSVPQRRGYIYQEGFITSPDGHCRAFDAKAQGTVFSNGLGIVVLKRLQDARADGDLIYAVIKGASVNNDGSARVSFTAPSVDGQAEAIAMAQATAGIDPATISYIEAHGTGTALGDPVEIAGLTQAFRIGTDKTGFCAIGSVKTNIGHLDAAAGVTGLIKTALALHHKVLPATLHYQSPNARLELSQTPFVVNAQLRPWPEGPTPRRAGVSSLGAGGTNAHVVLEEASERVSKPPNRPEQLLVLSARTPEALQAATDRLRSCLEEHPEMPLADAAFTLQVGRRRFAHRRALVASDREKAIAMLAERDGQRVVSEARETRGAEIVFLFPGQGAQYVNMGRRLYETEQVVRNEIDSCAELLRPHLDLDLKQILYPSKEREQEAQKQLTQTMITQPAMFIIEYAIARLFEHWGVVPVGMIGHSLGDYVAACLAGVFSRDDALVLLAKRARLMQDLPAGSMLAVRAKADEVQELLSSQVAIAGLNAETMTVLSGDTDAIRAVEETLTSRGIASKYMATSHAFHSAHMDPIVDRFASIVATIPRRPPKIPFVSSLTGDWIADGQATDPRFWARQLREPVQFAEGAARLFDDPNRILLEIGPGQTLATLVRQHPARKANQVIVNALGPYSDGSNATSAVLLAAGRLWAAGADLNWPALHDGVPRCRIPLPTYPFDRKRYWIEPCLTGDELHKTSTQQLQAEEHQNMTTPNGEAPAGPARKDQLVERLQALFAELSGLGTADLKPHTGFLELGLDSLLLTQASAAIQKSFRVKIPFRDLLEDLSTLDALAGRLDGELPPEPKVIAEVRSPPSVVARLAVAGPGAERVAAGNSLERIFAQQLELMSRQLDMLKGEGAQQTLFLAENSRPLAKNLPRAEVIEVRKPAPDRVKATNQPTISFGPYRPPIRSASGGLSPKQDQRLKEFVGRYTQRTPASKAFTARHRAMLADPRSVAGFRMLWKEMVYPIVASRSAGSKLWDLDGNEYVDLVNGFGAILFGHNPPFVRGAIEKQLGLGIEIGPQTSLAGEVAALVTECTGMERVAFCNTGSEAVTAAIRVARTVSGRDLIVSFAGAYHGVFDEVLVRPTNVNSELRSMPIAPGIPSSMTDNIIVLEYGSAAALETLKSRGSELAAVLVEPVQSRRPELQPVEFLRDVRSITESTGVALIFDDIVSGFRAHLGGTQAIFGIRADLCTYGKVVGGGLPIGLVTGSPKYMDALDGGQWSYGDESLPEVGVTFFAGTFVRHPLALAAARAVLLHLRDAGPELQRNLNLRTTRLVDVLNEHAERVGAPVRVTHFSSWFCFNFPQDVPYASLFYAYMRDKGVHIWEGRAGFLTTAHTESDIDRVVAAFKETIEEMQEAEFLPGGAPENLPGARLGKDLNGRPAWFVPDSDRPGKYLQVNVEKPANV